MGDEWTGNVVPQFRIPARALPLSCSTASPRSPPLAPRRSLDSGWISPFNARCFSSLTSFVAGRHGLCCWSRRRAAAQRRCRHCRRASRAATPRSHPPPTPSDRRRGHSALCRAAHGAGRHRPRWSACGVGGAGGGRRTTRPTTPVGGRRRDARDAARDGHVDGAGAAAHHRAAGRRCGRDGRRSGRRRVVALCDEGRRGRGSGTVVGRRPWGPPAPRSARVEVPRVPVDVARRRAGVGAGRPPRRRPRGRRAAADPLCALRRP
ncbi:hypothetical protein BU14_0113s0028 [Porphyra umbilicalis]|uniref:Uncharacterized protein n=1 Tax=Porphyra umbilicalis TaxID=2786 RepID=A0A1X6PBR4_PORUM|nr:hypothetical protein BU14_0113s0028 [Porphyra umbilicalis]|eukprot:OSX78284.1 hypothetical protein BU14_0113s0028 [Porphyra umbilicalis]